MTEARRTQLKAYPKEYVLAHMRIEGIGYRKAARHFAAKHADGGGTDEDRKYLMGRFRRWSHEAKHAGDPTVTATATTATASTPTATPAPAPVDPNAPVPGSLADLAIGDDLEPFLLARIRQLEDATARFALKGSNAAALATLARVSNDMRAQLAEHRKAGASDIGSLPPEERAARLAMAAPAFPDSALRACVWAWHERGCP